MMNVIFIHEKRIYKFFILEAIWLWKNGANESWWMVKFIAYNLWHHNKWDHWDSHNNGLRAKNLMVLCIGHKTVCFHYFKATKYWNENGTTNIRFLFWWFVHFAFDIYHCCVLFHNIGKMLMCSKIIAFTWEFSKTPCGQILVAQATWDDSIQQWGKYGIIAWLWWMQF